MLKPEIAILIGRLQGAGYQYSSNVECGQHYLMPPPELSPVSVFIFTPHKGAEERNITTHIIAGHIEVHNMTDAYYADIVFQRVVAYFSFRTNIKCSVPPVSCQIMKRFEGVESIDERVCSAIPKLYALTASWEQYAQHKDEFTNLNGQLEESLHNFFSISYSKHIKIATQLLSTNF